MDEDIEVCVEEGEISDDSDTYTPLERPVNYSTTLAHPKFSPAIDSESDGVVQSSSASDSDSDCAQRKSKKPKVKLKKPTAQARPKKYDIWSTRVQEDVLSETLNYCDVSTKDRSRNVESYDYSLSRNHNVDRMNNKRNRDERRNSNIKPLKRNDTNKDVKGKSRHIMELIVDASCTNEEFARDVANKLCEEHEALIVKVVDVCGKEKTAQLFNEVRQIEEDGGMLIMNQSRRRTPGGIFFFLVKHDTDLTREQQDKIFEQHNQQHKEVNKKKRRIRRKKSREAAQKSKAKNLPPVLTRDEIVEKLSMDSKRSAHTRESDQDEVVNPPPTPETDGGHVDSGDNTDGGSGTQLDSTQRHAEQLIINTIAPNTNAIQQLHDSRKLEEYADDFLDINDGADMDVF